MYSYQSNSCIFIGLPSSGKSSFIGALWHVVETGEIESQYTVSVQPKDREYLNQLRSNFLGCKSPERTKTGFVKRIELELKDSYTNKISNLIFPDLSGETYESLFEYRQLTKEYLDELSGCNSIMLFVNPDYLQRPFLINDAYSLLDFEGIDEEANSGNQEKKWSPKISQTQLVLVDLLQIIGNELPLTCKIGIIISAWDVILEHDKKQTPDAWLIDYLPLLYQFLSANPNKLSFKVFGVSSQGGKYSSDIDGNYKLHAKIKQSERIIVQEGNSVSNDISLPIKWILE